MSKPSVFYARSRFADETAYVGINHERFERYIGNKLGICAGLSIVWLCAMIASYSDRYQTRRLMGYGMSNSIPTVHEFYAMARMIFAKVLAEARASYQATPEARAAAEAFTPTPEAIKLLQFIKTVHTYTEHFSYLSFMDGVLNLQDPRSVEFFFHYLSQQIHQTLCAILRTPNHAMAMYIHIRKTLISISFYDPNTAMGELRTTFEYGKSPASRIRSLIQMFMESAYIKTFLPGAPILLFYSFYKSDNVINFCEDVLKIGGRHIPRGAAPLTTQDDHHGYRMPKRFLFETITDPITANFALYMATYMGNTVLVENLLNKHHADPNAISAIGWNPLHYAAFFGYVDIAQRLLNKNANPNLPTSLLIDGVFSTPLELAKHGHQLRMMKLLLSRGAVK